MVEDLFMDFRREGNSIIVQCNTSFSHSLYFKVEMERKMKH